jgi:polyisoprenoid-binding protein YceI
METSMIRRIARAPLRALLVTLVLASASMAQSAGPTKTRLVLRPESRLWIEGGSNLHDWKCDAKSVVAEVRVTRGATAQPNGVESGTLTVPVAGVECGNGKMNENLRKALKSNEHQEIRFSITSAELVDSGEGGVIVVAAHGDLTVAGTTRPIVLSVTGADAGDGTALKVSGRVEMKMTDFGIQPPTALLGMLRTKNEVRILFNLVMGYAELEARLTGDPRP